MSIMLIERVTEIIPNPRNEVEQIEAELKKMAILEGFKPQELVAINDENNECTVPEEPQNKGVMKKLRKLIKADND